MNKITSVHDVGELMKGVFKELRVDKLSAKEITTDGLTAKEMAIDELEVGEFSELDELKARVVGLEVKMAALEGYFGRAALVEKE